MSVDLPEFERAVVVNPEPGDVLLFTVTEPESTIDRDAVLNFEQEIQKLFPENKVVVVIGGLSVELLRPVESGLLSREELKLKLKFQKLKGRGCPHFGYAPCYDRKTGERQCGDDCECVCHTDELLSRDCPVTEEELAESEREYREAAEEDGR